MDVVQHTSGSTQGSPDYMIELDMLVSREEMEELRPDMMETLIGGRYRRKRKAYRPLSKRWEKGVVPYSLASGTFCSKDRRQIYAAMAEWERYTCIDFKPAGSGDVDRIHLRNGAGCSSWIGKRGGAQEINLARPCRVRDVIVHELGHAIGFYHEQSRPDRDQYLRINFENIEHNHEHNFRKASSSYLNTYDVAYDLTSIMHYGRKYFSKNGEDTITTKDSRYQDVIGRGDILSFRDIKLANEMYGCSAHCGNRRCPGEGFLGKDCKCWCSGNSDNVPVMECNRPNSQAFPVFRPPPATASSCSDQHSYCYRWSVRGQCQQNPGFMQRYCRRSCGVCGSSITSNCIDFNSNCGMWARRGDCRSHTTYMNTWCKRSCGVC